MKSNYFFKSNTWQATLSLVTCSNRTFSTMELVKRFLVCRCVGPTWVVQMPSKYISTSIWVIWKWFMPNHIMNQYQITCFDLTWDPWTGRTIRAPWMRFLIPELDEAPTENREFWQIHSISHFEMMFHLHHDTWKRDLSNKFEEVELIRCIKMQIAFWNF